MNAHTLKYCTSADVMREQK